MDERHTQALLNALGRQREIALNACAQLEAELELTRADLVELAELKKEVESLRAQLSADAPAPPPSP